MFIRTFVPLIIAGLIKYTASRVLFNQFEKMIEEGARKREQNSHNAETAQSEN